MDTWEHKWHEKEDASDTEGKSKHTAVHDDEEIPPDTQLSAGRAAQQHCGPVNNTGVTTGTTIKSVQCPNTKVSTG